MNKSIIGFIAMCLISVLAHAELAKMSESIENSKIKYLLGHWDINDSSINPEGKWQNGQGASWHFYTILDGHAIQDDWISPPLNQAEPDGGRQFGTNIRIFNPKENRWEMAWASVKGQKVDTFIASETENEIIMTGVFNGRSSRITFYQITANSFAWKLEFQQPNSTNWLEVYRIKATRSVKSS